MMRKYIRFFAVLLCLLLLAGCQKDPLDKDPTRDTTPETTQPAQPTAGTQPSDDPATASLKIMRFTMDQNHKFAAAYFGYRDTYAADVSVDPFLIMEAYTSQLYAQYPFLAAIPTKNIVGGDRGDLFCIVPRDPKSHVRILRCTETDYGCVYDNLIYESDRGDPVLLFCNNSGVDPDTQVIITDSDGNQILWHPTVDSTDALAQIRNDQGIPLIQDFTAYWELLLSDYIELCSNGWFPVDEEMLADTSWSGEDARPDGSSYSFQVTFHADRTADIYWNDGEEHEFLGAAWKIFERNGFQVLSIDLKGLAGIREYNLLTYEYTDMLYTIRDISDSAVTPGFESLHRVLYLDSSNAPLPEEMIGTWDMAWSEVEGDINEAKPGVCTIRIYRDNNGDLRIDYIDKEFPDSNFQNKTLTVYDGEMYYQCGNDQWVADVGYIGPFGTQYSITLLEDGTLLFQRYSEMDSQMFVSYSWFTRK